MGVFVLEFLQSSSLTRNQRKSPSEFSRLLVHILLIPNPFLNYKEGSIQRHPFRWDRAHSGWYGCRLKGTFLENYCWNLSFGGLISLCPTLFHEQLPKNQTSITFFMTKNMKIKINPSLSLLNSYWQSFSSQVKSLLLWASLFAVFQIVGDGKNHMY